MTVICINVSYHSLICLGILFDMIIGI